MSTLPTTPEEITPAWLGAQLGGVIDSIHIEPVTDRSGINGEMFRLHLRGAAADVPPSIMAKFPAQRPGGRGVARYQRWYEREVRFYRELASETPIRTPHCYFAEITPEDDFVLLLEDLGALRQGEQVAGCTAQEATRAVEAAAALHARWWTAEAVAHPWLPFTTVGLDRAGPVSGAFVRAWWLVRDRMPPVAREALDRGVEQYPELLAEISRGPVTVCHGDYRLDNVFFDDTDEGRIVAFDWQFACRARGTYDIAYFLALDLEPALLAANLEPLLAHYLDVLRQRGVEGYTEEMCHRDYAISLILATAVFAIGAAGEQPSESARLTHEVGLQRLGAAVEDAVQRGWLQSL